MKNSGPISVRVGPMSMDVPRTAGYYGGVGLAFAFGLIEWPVAVFIGAIPAVQLLRRQDLGRPVNFVVQLFEGAAKPVGGDAEGTVELTSTPRPLRRAAQADPAAAVAGAARAAGRAARGAGARARRRAAAGTGTGRRAAAGTGTATTRRRRAAAATPSDGTARTTRTRRRSGAAEATPGNGRRRGRTTTAAETTAGGRRRATRRSPVARTPRPDTASSAGEGASTSP